MFFSICSCCALSNYIPEVSRYRVLVVFTNKTHNVTSRSAIEVVKGVFALCPFHSGRQLTLSGVRGPIRRGRRKGSSGRSFTNYEKSIAHSLFLHTGVVRPENMNNNKIAKDEGKQEEPQSKGTNQKYQRDPPISAPFNKLSGECPAAWPGLACRYPHIIMVDSAEQTAADSFHPHYLYNS